MTVSSVTSSAQPNIDVSNPMVTESNPVVESPIAGATETAPQVDPTTTTEPNAGEPGAADPNANAANDKRIVPEWMQKRINFITGQKYEAERTAEEAVLARKAAEARLEEMLAKLNKTEPTTTTTTPEPQKAALTEEEVERRALEKAAQIAKANEFTKACNTVADAGKKQYKEEWDEALSNLNLVGALGKGVPPTFLENVIELKDPHKVLHYLGMKAEEGERISRLTPTKMAIELARIEAALAAPPVEPKPPVSNAPAPVIPVGGQAKNVAPPSLDDPHLDAAEWYALRAKQLDEKRNRYR